MKYPANKRNFIIGLGVMVLVFMLDQLSKAGIMGMFVKNHDVWEITSFFNVVMVWNRGVSFGMFAGQNQPMFLIIVSLLIIGILCMWLYKNQVLLVAAALGCIMGGAIGNVIDRVRFGAVADFLDFHIGAMHWPAFNVADSSIFIGVVLLCAHSMFMEPKHRTKGTEL